MTDEIEGLFDAAHKAHREIKKKHLPVQARVMTLLEQFYQDRRVPYDVHLVIDSLYNGETRIQNQGYDLQTLWDSGVRESKLKAYQNEMKAFTGFLISIYINARERG